jgi:hypothetical protein
MGGWRSTGQVGMKNCGGVAFVCFSSSPCACLVSIQLFFSILVPEIRKIKNQWIEIFILGTSYEKGGKGVGNLEIEW